MTFSQAKRQLAPSRKGMALNIFITAALTAACFFIPYMISDEGYFLFFGDFNVQQIPFYQLAHNAVRNGEWGWSFNTDLGANFIGSYSFYLLGSPFFWLTIPFPNSFVPYLMGPLLILKFGFTALTAFLYLDRFAKNPLTAQIGAMLYAFSGFSVYNVFFNHFHEPLIFFPLLLLAFELLITENRRGVFAVVVALSAIVNYFFFVGMLVFGLIYMVIRLVSKAVKPHFTLILWIIFEALLGIALAAFILLPSYKAIANADRVDNVTLGWNSLLYGKESIYANVFEIFFFPPDLPARPVMFPKADVKWSSLGAWMPVFSMVGVFAWCKAKQGNWIKRIIITSAVMAMVPILNSAFYMFNDAYYARWFYMPILMMCLATVLAVESADIDWKKPFISVSAITVGIALIIGLFPQKNADSKDIIIGLFTDPKNPMYRTRFIVTVAIAICGLLVLALLLYLRKQSFKRFLQTSVIAVAIVSIVYANCFIFWGKQHSFTNEEMIDNLIESELTLPGDPDTYRIDVYSGVDNTAMFLGYSSINCFHSIVPTSVTEFYTFIGEQRGVASRPTEDSYPIRSLLSVKYLVARRSGDSFIDEHGAPKMFGFNYVDSKQGFNIYENENYIPYGFSYDTYVTIENFEHYYKGDKAKLMLKAIVLNPIQIKKYGHMFKSMDETYGEGNNLYLSNSSMAADCEARRETAATSFKTGKNSFEATVTREKDTLVFFSIPYDEGWTATVNGKAVPVEKVNIGFMAVPVEAGESTIVFRYETPGLKTGFIISGAALLILIAYVFIFRVKKPRTPEYPEGDELLDLWSKPDLDTEEELCDIEIVPYAEE